MLGQASNEKNNIREGNLPKQTPCSGFFILSIDFGEVRFFPYWPDDFLFHSTYVFVTCFPFFALKSLARHSFEANCALVSCYLVLLVLFRVILYCHIIPYINPLFVYLSDQYLPTCSASAARFRGDKFIPLLFYHKRSSCMQSS